MRPFGDYPLLRRLVWTQIVILTLIFGTLGAFMTLGLQVKQSIELEQTKAKILPFLERRQEEWRTWAQLGMAHAMEKEFVNLTETFPYLSLKIQPSATATESSDSKMVIPNAAPRDIPFVLVANIDKNSLSQNFVVEGYLLWLPILALLTLALLVFYTGLFIRKKIYFPLQSLGKALAVRGSSQNHPEPIAATGEIADIIAHFQELMQEARANEATSAIALTAQQLAHDVRMPFSKVRGFMDAISHTKDSQKILDMTQRFVPKIDLAITEVNSMIEDVMEIGRNDDLVQESKNIEDLIHRALTDRLDRDKHSKLAIEYNLEHRHMIFVDSHKVLRLFSNLIANALQAMDDEKHPRLWIHSCDVDSSDQVEITIGNLGYIDTNTQKRLFDEFFTQGKKGGTGLGLAIAKKVTLAHGGSITCRSTKELGVEFTFALPRSRQKSKFTGSLIAGVSRISRADSELSNSEQEQLQSYEKLLRQAARSNNRPLSLLICDDEDVYRDLIRAQLDFGKCSPTMVNAEFVDSGEKAMKALQNANFDLVIMDVDLGPGMDGFETVAKLRAQHPALKICMHSNRGATDYGPIAFNAGADLFLPKPMSRLHLFKLMLSVLDDSSSDRQPATTEDHGPKESLTKPDTTVELPILYLVEDELIMRMGWELTAKGRYRLTTFAKGREFIDSLEELDLNQGLVITDYHLEPGVKGTDVATAVYQKNSNTRVMLSSNLTELEDHEKNLFERILPKVPSQALAELETSFESQ